MGKGIEEARGPYPPSSLARWLGGDRGHGRGNREGEGATRQGRWAGLLGWAMAQGQGSLSLSLSISYAFPFLLKLSIFQNFSKPKQFINYKTYT